MVTLTGEILNGKLHFLCSVEDIFRRDNLRTDGLDEVENETWEQTEEILQNLFDEKIQLQNLKVEKAHRLGNKEKSNNRTIVAKFSSFKDKQKILSETPKLKGSNININEDYSKETLRIWKEKWKTFKEPKKNGTDALLVYDKTCRKQ